jgi:heparosan-N-sulfate-glucuronate 5-epimerase
MEESKKITLNIGDVSWNEILGTYYIDMRPALIHYTQNIYDGKFDENGVPMCLGPNGTLLYNPVNIAQYGFILHAQWAENKENSLLQKILNCIKQLELLKTEKEDYTVWLHDYGEVKYNIDAPWPSAMTQGEIISLYLRVYQITNDNDLLETTKRAYNFLKIDYLKGGARRIDENGDLWLEEYPSDPPSYVLNGFIYAVFGLIDLYRVTKNVDVKRDLDSCILTLENNLHRFDAGYWSYYDLLKKELVRYYYQKNVHVPQLEVLYVLAGKEVFNKYKVKWERTVNPFNFVLVQVMYRILHRWRKLQKKISK